MPDPISEYQRWKAQGANLRTEAKQAMESRFRELLTEAASLAEEYHTDFGVALKPPSQITAFRYKVSGKPKAKKAARQPAAKAAAKPAAEAPRPEAAEQKPDPKVARLKRQLAAAKTKLDAAKAAGAPTRPLEDRVYEIEDALQLAAQKS
ncbi:MAG TPA: hypothetical protein VF767_05460 [Bryobacteraceae bacterium]